ncbi:MAG: aromatic amino acid ammonia-lyase [Desulfobacterales bacterium]|nr:aromatic amino acid ammonia-lyase [Desulfobacterales bacterium]
MENTSATGSVAETAEIVIGDGEVPLAALMAVAFEGRPVRVSSAPAWRAKLQACRAVLERSLDAGQRIYGVSTGVGYSSHQTVDSAHVQGFAYQIIRQHGCGLGEMFPVPQARAIVFARLVSLAKGYSAVQLELLEALCGLLNRGVTPVIPMLGSVGASGDLTPLSYVASVLAGEREAYYQGEVLPAAEALERAGLTVHRFAPKESLSVMNGTAVMAAVGAVTTVRLERTLSACEAATALAAEVLHGRSQAFAPIAHRLKHHPGQIAAAEAIRTAIGGSGMIDSGKEENRIIQDPYSIRCAPHVIGAARDGLTWAMQVLHRELNSVNDNPIVDPERGETVDLLKIAAASVADLVDRQFALVLDSRLNLGLPETLVAYPGCGVKALQITCSALTALAVQRSAPDTVLSRPTEVSNQDKVSMGLNAALNAAEAVTLLQQVLATLLVALSNAAALRDASRFSKAAAELLARVRAASPVLTEDRRLDHDLRRLAQAIDDGF